MLCHMVAPSSGHASSSPSHPAPSLRSPHSKRCPHYCVKCNSTLMHPVRLLLEILKHGCHYSRGTRWLASFRPSGQWQYLIPTFELDIKCPLKSSSVFFAVFDISSNLRSNDNVSSIIKNSIYFLFFTGKKRECFPEGFLLHSKLNGTFPIVWKEYKLCILSVYWLPPVK